MSNAIASNVKSAGTVVGKVLVAKRTFTDWLTKLAGTEWDVKVGTVVYALMEGTANDWRGKTKVAKVIYNGAPGEIPLNSDFDANWAVIEPDDRLKGKIFVFTGALTNTREYYKTLVECFGGNFGSAVTGKTSYLVMGDTTFQGDPHHMSTKAKKAKSMGVPVIGETLFINMINKGV